MFTFMIDPRLCLFDGSPSLECQHEPCRGNGASAAARGLTGELVVRVQANDFRTRLMPPATQKKTTTQFCKSRGLPSAS